MIDYPAVPLELGVSPMRVRDRCHQFGRFVLDDLDERQIESLVEVGIEIRRIDWA